MEVVLGTTGSPAATLGLLKMHGTADYNPFWAAWWAEPMLVPANSSAAGAFVLTFFGVQIAAGWKRRLP